MKKNNEYYRQLRISSREEGRRLAKVNPPDYMYGCILYWTEGSKGRWSIDFTNSDKCMMQYFWRFLKKYFDCKDEDVTIYVNAYLENGLGMDDIQKNWLDSLGLPITCLRKFTNRAKYYDSTKSRRKNKQLYGICKLRVHNTSIVEKIIGSIESEFNMHIELK